MEEEAERRSEVIVKSMKANHKGVVKQIEQLRKDNKALTNELENIRPKAALSNVTIGRLASQAYHYEAAYMALFRSLPLPMQRLAFFRHSPYVDPLPHIPPGPLHPITRLAKGGTP